MSLAAWERRVPHARRCALRGEPLLDEAAEFAREATIATPEEREQQIIYALEAIGKYLRLARKALDPKDYRTALGPGIGLR